MRCHEASRLCEGHKCAVVGCGEIRVARGKDFCRRGMLSTIMEPLKIDPVPLGASQIPTHKPSRCCVAVV